MTVSAKVTHQCPLPPADFAERDVPIKELNLSATTLYRIHKTVRDPIFFTRRSKNADVYRFDAPNDEFGVLYASESFAACMAETVIRDRFIGSSLPLVLEEASLIERSISTLGHAKPEMLKLAAFTKPLIGLGFTAQVLSDPHYAAPNQWSKAVHDHPAEFDGIYCNSRYANGPSVAIFDRVEIVQRDKPIPLMNFPEAAIFVNKHKIALV
jgi:hypothetical protein